MHRPPHNPTSRCSVVSDLHLFTRRSRADQHVPGITAAAQASETLVLAGDIFDFRWSQWPSTEETADRAVEWLDDLMAASPSTRIHYVLGNHDHVPALMRRLDDVAERAPRFRWHPYHLRLGNAMFLHGDVANPRMTNARLHAFRAGFAHDRPARPAAHTLYQGATALGLHIVGSKLLFPRHAVVRRLSRHLDELGSAWSRDVRNVYFGHTHLALNGHEYRGRRFYNCGSPMRGLRFQILEADLS